MLRHGEKMKTKIIILAIGLTLIPSISNAKSFHVPRMSSPHIARISRTIKYSYTTHRLSRVRCPYAGCRSDIQP